MSSQANDDNNDVRRMLAQSVAAFFASDAGLERSRRNRYQGEQLDGAIWTQMTEQGWLASAVPESVGGLGLGVGELAVIAEQLGRGCAPEPLVGTALAQQVLVAVAPGNKRDEWLRGSASGERVLALAWQTQAAQLDPLVQVNSEDRLLPQALSGQWVLVQPATADGFVVSVTKADGVSLLAIDRDCAGVRVEQQAQADGSVVLRLILSDVAIDDHQCLSRGTDGAIAIRRGLVAGVVLASAELLGLADRLLSQTISYVSERKQFDQPLSAFQVLRHRLVDLYMQRELMRAALQAAIRSIDGDDPLPVQEREASRAKARASDAALLIGREAVQLHGAMGYTEEAGVGVALRRILTLSAWFGNARHHRRRYLALNRLGGGCVR